LRMADGSQWRYCLEVWWGMREWLII